MLWVLLLFPNNAKTGNPYPNGYLGNLTARTAVDITYTLLVSFYEILFFLLPLIAIIFITIIIII